MKVIVKLCLLILSRPKKHLLCCLCLHIDITSTVHEPLNTCRILLKIGFKIGKAHAESCSKIREDTQLMDEFFFIYGFF